MVVIHKKMPENLSHLDVVQSMWTLGMISTSSMPDIATDLLVAGFDSPSLRQLAGLTQEELYCAEELFRKTLVECERRNFTIKESVMKYAFFVADEIVSGRESPYEGARKIWKATLKLDEPNFHELDTFSFAASEYPGRPEDQAFFSAEIVKEAKRLLEESGNR